jgi:hypothetical protein
MKKYKVLRHSLAFYNQLYAVIKHVLISIAHNLRNKGSRHQVSRKISKALLKNPSDDDPPFMKTNKNAEFTFTTSKFGIFAFLALNKLVHCRSPPLSFVFRFYQIRKMEDNKMKEQKKIYELVVEKKRHSVSKEFIRLIITVEIEKNILISWQQKITYLLNHAKRMVFKLIISMKLKGDQ